MKSAKSFWGRNQELKLLNELKKKKSAGLVTLTGRRRIGKSRLIQEFAQQHGKFIKFQGLYPNKGVSRADQLQEFASDLSKQFHAPEMRFETWSQAFNELAVRARNTECVILLDEISWMAHDDPLFSAQLQKAWDTELSLNAKLILVLCGSVSSWIQDNVIQNANFVGRVSLQIHLQELTLSESSRFWDQYGGKNLSSYEKLKILSVTGGVPKYLEEINPNIPALSPYYFRPANNVRA
jgi:AAA+ ATPase superfamily predicted ATPase